MIKKYDQYKDSGNIWIGEIPASWQISKIKYESNVYNGNSLNQSLKEKFESSEEEDLPYVATKNIDPISQNIDYNGGIRIPKVEKKYKVAPAGSALLCIEGGSAGKKIAYTNRKVCFVNKLACFEYPNKFLFYFLQSESFKNQFYNVLSGLIGGVSISLINNFQLPTPSNLEQTKIAEYLDHQTGLIDAIIEKKQQLIDKLKEQRQAIINEAVTKGLNQVAPMKDSGVEWLGEIPEHWRFIKLSYITDRIGDGLHSTPKYTDEESFYFINGNNLINGKIEIFEKTRTVNEDEFKRLWISIDSSSLLLSINGTIGNVALYNDEPVILGKSAAFINCSEDLNREFLRYLFLSSFYQNHFQHEVTGTTIYNLSLNSIRNCKICLPNMEEQLNIIQFLDGALVKYDTAIDKTKLTIQNLKSFRQSIISEAVTGKIDVREWEPTLKETV